jgi:large subunit ribosomal protein L9
MKIILRQDVKKLGRRGDALEVAEGYARNFLLPQSLALEATPQNIEILERQSEREAKQLEKEKKETSLLGEKLEKLSCTLSRQAGEDEKLFGSVTASHIASALKKEGIEIDKKNIELEKPIRELGVYTVLIKLSHEVKAKLKVWVVKK